MKHSVSLSGDDVATLDEHPRVHGLTSRSAALQRAIRLLRHPALDEDYAAAWDEWHTSGEDAAWEETAADGFADVAR